MTGAQFEIRMDRTPQLPRPKGLRDGGRALPQKQEPAQPGRGGSHAKVSDGTHINLFAAGNVLRKPRQRGRG